LIVGFIECNGMEWNGIEWALTFLRSFWCCAAQEKHVLERYELRDLFAPQPCTAGEGAEVAVAKWKVLYDQVALDSDHGRTMIHFVAQRLV
jgi:hypothetical protein